MKKKDSFIFYRDWFLAIDNLDNSIRLEVYDAIMHKVFGEKDIDLSPEAQIAICFVTPMIERDINKYKQICERRKSFGRKGGVAKATKSYPKVAKGSKSQHVLASVADNDIQDTKVSMSISNKEIKEENTNVLKKKCPETDLEQAFETFRRKYKKYGGSARGFETEFTNLAKKHKDWKEIIPMLDYALEEENKARQDALAKNEFFPQMKNLQTYINQRSWENYSDGWESYNPNAYHPQGLEYDDDFDAYRFYGGDPTYDLFDGYTNENRPDGARVVQQIFVYQWSALTRTWIKQ